MSKKLHIVCFDAPSPPDYGGAFDLYYKIIALASEGVEIILHYFNYKEGRGAQGLEKYCSEIYEYRRKGFLNSLISRQAHIIASRIDTKLVERLNKDEHPVLLEGIHSTGIIPAIKKNKKILLRLHNDEAVYYANLAASEKTFFKKIYYQREGRLLATYQAQLPKNLDCIAVSQTDVDTFRNSYDWEHIQFLPCFIPWQQIATQTGIGDYCLYQGNLSVAENESAVVWLIENVFAHSQCKFIVAGKSPSIHLKKIIAQYPNIQLNADPTDEELEILIANAQVHVLPSFNQTGVKLKLIHALFNGRHCISNKAGVAGSGLEAAVTVAEDADQFINFINTLMTEPFGDAGKNKRKAVLSLYNNMLNAKKLNALL